MPAFGRGAAGIGGAGRQRESSISRPSAEVVGCGKKDGLPTGRGSGSAEKTTRPGQAGTQAGAADQVGHQPAEAGRCPVGSFVPRGQPGESQETQSRRSGRPSRLVSPHAHRFTGLGRDRCQATVCAPMTNLCHQRDRLHEGCGMPSPRPLCGGRVQAIDSVRHFISTNQPPKRAVGEPRI